MSYRGSRTFEKFSKGMPQRIGLSQGLMAERLPEADPFDQLARALLADLGWKLDT